MLSATTAFTDTRWSTSKSACPRNSSTPWNTWAGSPTTGMPSEVTLCTCPARSGSWIITLKSLRRSVLFGRLPGGVAADLTDRTLGALTTDKAVRVMRTSQDGKAFSHAVVRGDHVAFVRGVIAQSGQYRWSGPSLLVDRPGQYPLVATEGPYADAVTTVDKALGAKVKTRTWVMIHDPDLSLIHI